MKTWLLCVFFSLVYNCAPDVSLSADDSKRSKNLALKEASRKINSKRKQKIFEKKSEVDTNLDVYMHVGSEEDAEATEDGSTPEDVEESFKPENKVLVSSAIAVRAPRFNPTLSVIDEVLDEGEESDGGSSLGTVLSDQRLRDYGAEMRVIQAKELNLCQQLEAELESFSTFRYLNKSEETKTTSFQARLEKRRPYVERMFQEATALRAPCVLLGEERNVMGLQYYFSRLKAMLDGKREADYRILKRDTLSAFMKPVVKLPDL